MNLEINPLIQEVLTVREQLRRFQQEHERVFEEYFLLAREYNRVAEKAKQDLRQVNFPAKRTDLGFGIIVQKKTERGYDPRVLALGAPDLLAVPGVVVKINKAEVERLAATRTDWMAAAKDAHYEIPITTTVTGLNLVDVDV